MSAMRAVSKFTALLTWYNSPDMALGATLSLRMGPPDAGAIRPSHTLDTPSDLANQYCLL